MKLALECNTELLELVQPFADFDWILVDKYMSDKVYAEWYRNSDNPKFVDNSVTEKGEPCSLQDLKAVFEDCHGTFMVAPDFIGDYKSTVEGYKECIAACPKETVVGALQGSTPEEALKCLEVFDHPWVLVPYRVGGSKKGDPNWLMALRRQLVVAHIPADRYVHLLGFTELNEFRWYNDRPNVRSVDTDVPIRAGLMVQDIDEFDRTQDTSKVKLTKDNWSAICRNVALLRKAIS